MDSIRFDRGLSSADLGATRVARQVERESVADRVNVRDGQVTCQGVAEAHGLPFTPLL